MNAIESGTVIKQLLLNAGFTSAQIFAIIAPEGTVLPYITYNRINASFGVTKDGGSLSQITLSLWTADYDEGLLRINTIIQTFQNFKTKLPQALASQIHTVSIDNADEGIDETAPATFRQSVLITINFLRQW